MDNAFQGNHYAIGKSGKIVAINELDPSNRYALGPFRCIECGSNMVPHKGRVREHHFKHLGPRTPACADETYLHYLAKMSLFETIHGAMASGSPYIVEYERPIVCDRYANEFDFICRSESEVEPWDITRLFDRVELETAHAGFVPDVLLSSSKSEDVVFLEIRVTHGCEAEKIKSGIRIIEVEVGHEDEIDQLRNGISLQDHNTRSYNLKKVKPKEKQCQKPCLVYGTAFVVFESGKSIVLTEPFEKLLRVQSRRSTKLFKYLGPCDDIAPWDRVSVYFENSVEARFKEGFDVRSCLLCKKGGLGQYEKPIFCFEQGIETEINTAHNCKFFAPVATEVEARKRYERNVGYLERRVLGSDSNITNWWATETDAKLLED